MGDEEIRAAVRDAERHEDRLTSHLRASNQSVSALRFGVLANRRIIGG